LKLDRDKLIRAREMLGYGIETTAQEAGVSKNSVLRAEHEEDIRPVTARKIAAALDVRVADLIGESEILKVQPPLPDFNGERRTDHLSAWKKYLSRRAEWCEKVLQKSPDEEYNNPFKSLDTAIQWAIYVGIESSDVRRTILEEGTVSPDEDLRALAARFVAVSDETDARVKAMMEDASLGEEQKKQIELRLIRGGAA
jgi:DNA-binding XRE family transcriptional regulator